MYVSDYLKRIRQVENFDHYLLPQPNTFMNVPPSYHEYSDVYPYDPYHNEPHFNDYSYVPSEQKQFRELIQTTEFPSDFTENSENLHASDEEVKEKNQVIAFKYSGMKQLNYSIDTPDSLHLIDVDYGNDVYFLHHKVILRVNLSENGAQFERVAVIDDTHEEIKEAHVS